MKSLRKPIIRQSGLPRDLISSSSSMYDSVVFEEAGEAYASPSLIIDVMNQDELISDTKFAFESTFSQQLGWIAEERLRGDVSKGMVEWGFRQAGGQISNAVVLAGEKVVIYIATRGHGVGYLGSASGGPVFSKTRIRVTLRDTYRNIEKSVVFDSFSKPISDPSRYILWEVGNSGSWCDKSRTSNGICGLYVITVTDESYFYNRADWTDEVELNDGMAFPKYESLLQVMAYEWRDVLGRVVINPSSNVAVMSGAEFRTTPVDPYTLDNESTVFDANTVFPTYAPSTDLTDEQKAVVIRDNAMALLSSQGPILTADSARVPILGMGMNTVVSSATRGLEASVRPASITDNTADAKRTFSLSGKPAITNVFDEMRSVASEHDQGDFVFSDPILAVSLGQDGNATSALDNGLAWVTTGVRTTGMTLSQGGYSQQEIVLCNEGYEFNIDGDFASSSSSSSSLSSSSDSSISSSSRSSTSSILECDQTYTVSGFDPVTIGFNTYDINGIYTFDFVLNVGGVSYNVYSGPGNSTSCAILWDNGWTITVVSVEAYKSYGGAVVNSCPDDGVWMSLRPGLTAGTVVAGEDSSVSSVSSLTSQGVSSASSQNSSSQSNLSSASTASSLSSVTSMSSF